MYKTLSINIETHNNLEILSEKMKVSKAGIIDTLVRNELKKVIKNGKTEDRNANRALHKIKNSLKLPKGTKINPLDYTDEDYYQAYKDDFII